MSHAAPIPVVAGSTLPLTPTTAADTAAWTDGLVALARCGFGWVDVVDSWLAFGELTTHQTTPLADAIAAAGMQVAGLSAIRRSVIDPVDGDANLAYTHRALDVAAALGAPVLSIGFHRPLTPLQQQWAFWAVPTSSDDAAMWDLAVRRLRDLVGHAASVNVAVSLELYEDTLLGSGAQAARLVEAVGSPALGINADLANLYRVPRRLTEGWLQTLTECLPYMNYWHVKNYRRAEAYPDGPYLSWPTALADGDINYRQALRLAIAAGYTGPICIEHYGGDGLTAQQRGMQYLTALLEDLATEAPATSTGARPEGPAPMDADE